MDDIRDFMARQRDVRRACLEELYRLRMTSRNRTLHHKRLADAAGLPEHDVLFALEVLAEQKLVVQEGFHWRIAPAGCLELETLISKE